MKRFTFLLGLMFCVSTAQAVLLGGEIRFTHLAGSTYRIEAIVYTALEWPSDYPEIEVYVDGQPYTVPREAPTDLFGEPNCQNVRISVYPLEHTFDVPGLHQAWFYLSARPAGVLNIPNSIGQTACIRATIVVSPGLGPNSSIRFGNRQSVTAWSWNTLVHDPGAFDPDGDSLSFELVAPLGSGCSSIMGYVFPTGAVLAWLDPASGVFHWNHPPSPGNWSLCIRGTEWRNGQLIGQVTRDMVLCVAPFTVGVNEVGDAEPLRTTLSPDGSLLHLRPSPLGFGVAEVLALDGRVALRQAMRRGEPIAVGQLSAGPYALRVTDAQGRVQLARFVKP